MGQDKAGIEAYLLLVKQINLLPNLGDEFESEEDVDAFEESINSAIDTLKNSNVAQVEDVKRLEAAWNGFKAGIQALTNVIDDASNKKADQDELGFREINLENYPDADLSGAFLPHGEEGPSGDELHIEGEINGALQELQLAVHDIGLYLQNKFQKGA